VKEKNKPVRAVPTAPRVEARSGGAGGEKGDFSRKTSFSMVRDAVRHATRDPAFEYTNTTTLYL
jgi:hypothetical protein